MCVCVSSSQCWPHNHIESYISFHFWLMSVNAVQQTKKQANKQQHVESLHCRQHRHKWNGICKHESREYLKNSISIFFKWFLINPSWNASHSRAHTLTGRTVHKRLWIEFRRYKNDKRTMKWNMDTRRREHQTKRSETKIIKSTVCKKKKKIICIWNVLMSLRVHIVSYVECMYVHVHKRRALIPYV